MGRAAFALAGNPGGVELADVFFLTPLMIADGEMRETRVVLEHDATRGGTGFRVQSRPAGAGDAAWKEHALGRLSALPESVAARFDLDLLRGRCTARSMTIEGAMLDNPENLVFWGDHWQSLRRVEVGEGEALALLDLPAELAGDLADLPLHPALLDVATAIVGLLDEGSYLPLSYRRVRVREALPSRLYSHVRRLGPPGGDTISADVTLLDENGTALVEIEGFTMKRVGAAVERLQQAAAPSRQPPVPARAPAPAAAGAAGRGVFAEGGMLSAEGVEAFLRILSRQPGARVAVSPRDLNLILEQRAKSRADGLLGDLSKATPARAAHPRPSVQTPLEPPRNDLERTLATVWQEILGIEEVGIHDNFYELGGDSVLGIQILARARDAGVELTSNQLFEHQTIAELAAELGGAVPATAAPAPGEAAEAGRRREVPSELLDRLLAERDGEDAYPLAPLQQGLLFHVIDNPRSGLYCEQVTLHLDTIGDPDLIHQAWRAVVERHPILRTSFVWQAVEEPLQVVHRRVDLPFEVYDWRELEPDEQERRLAELRRRDRERNFDVGSAPLLRLSLIRRRGDEGLLIVSYHHLLLDGWSVPLVAREAIAAYQAIREGRSLELPQPRPYREYIDWLGRQDLAEAGRYWRSRLAGFGAPTPLGGRAVEAGDLAVETAFKTRQRIFSEEETDRLEQSARRQRVTPNTLAQAAWALLLGRTSGQRDVVFGTSVAGRPASLEGIQSMIGLFVNTLPVRVAIPVGTKVSDWLRDLHRLQLELAAWEHTPLSVVQAASELPRGVPLFESVLGFANYGVPWGKDSAEEAFRYESRNHFPLNLTIYPRDALTLELVYDSRRFDDAAAAPMLEWVAAALSELAAAPDATVGEVEERLAASERGRRAERATHVAGVAQEKLRQRARRRPVAEGSEKAPVEG
jgi:aryl carrier-like protein